MKRSLTAVISGFMFSLAIPTGAVAAPSETTPRNVLHADLLAPATGQKMYGLYYERAYGSRRQASLVIGGTFAGGLRMDTAGGADVAEVDSDLGGLGAQARNYLRSAPTGFFMFVSLSLIGGRGNGKDSEGRKRTYTLTGYDVSLLGLGYQHLFFRLISLEATASFHQSLDWLWERGGGDHGTAGYMGIALAGGIGCAF